MKLVLKLLAALIVLLAAVVTLEIIASESGEVVVITTQDAEGQPVETRLWVVDHDGAAWLRSGSDQSGWYQRIVGSPTIQVQRGEQQFEALVVPTVAARDQINELMQAKYGWADSYIGMLFGRDDSIPLRLQLTAS